jgi:hypothetical protein
LLRGISFDELIETFALAQSLVGAGETVLRGDGLSDKSPVDPES